MANGAVIGLVVIVVIAMIAVGLYVGGVFDNLKPQKSGGGPPVSSPPATKPSSGTSKKEKGVKTEIMAQCDDNGVVKLNDKQIGTIEGWKFKTITASTRSGDVLSFHIHNGVGAGGLRCLIKRGEDYYATGDNEDFVIPNSNTVLLADTTKYGNAQKDNIDAIYDKNPELKDAPVKFAESQWIWDENECSECDVVFTVEIK